ncbi:cytochrome P450 [Schizophyllum commune]
MPLGGWEWETFTRWAEQYGPIVSSRILGRTVVIVNSYEKAYEMMERKSQIYSSRPRLTMPADLMGWGDGLAFVEYGPRLRAYRRIFHRELGSREAVSAYAHLQEAHAKSFARNCWREQERFREHGVHMSGSLVLAVAYGFHAKPDNDPIVRAANDAIEVFNLAASPSAYLVNLIPALKYVPEWVPGAGFKRQARVWRPLYGRMVDAPFEFVKDALKSQSAEPSFVAKALSAATSKEQEEIIKHAAGSMFVAGSETTALVIHAFFFFMTLHPEVQERAQAEIDTVIGRGAKLPEIRDRDRLPYVEALCKEVLRYHPPGPCGLPHASTQDDVQDGYLIPKESTIIPNIWLEKMSRDAAVYTDAHKFDIERFLGPTPEQDPREYVYGFGRRVCPGRLMADTSIFVTIAVCLTLFNIRAEGALPEYKTTGGPINHICPFKCALIPRHDDAVMIRLLGDCSHSTPA